MFIPLLCHHLGPPLVELCVGVCSLLVSWPLVAALLALPRGYEQASHGRVLCSCDKLRRFAR